MKYSVLGAVRVGFAGYFSGIMEERKEALAGEIVVLPKKKKIFLKEIELDDVLKDSLSVSRQRSSEVQSG